MSSLRSVAVSACALALAALGGCGGSGSGTASQLAGNSQELQALPPPAQAPPPQTTPSVASTPSISGQPPTQVTAGDSYTFTPLASGAVGSALTFSISNAPSWATFEPSTGQLSGTPGVQNAGTYSNVVISVTDGASSASLPAFSITVNLPLAGSGTASLSWMPPTTNTDGTTLGDLAGYRIYYGTDPNALQQMVDIPNAGITRYLLDNLAPGTWYFAVKAYTTGGEESALSNLASKTIA